MKYLETYLNKIIERGNIKLAESISKTSEEVGSQYLSNFSFTSNEIGLLFGNVQSGKTGQMFGIMCKAADLGFPVFVLLTTDNVVLQQQTLLRVQSDLDDFCVCGENDSRLFADNNLELPTIIVLKKNFKILKLWANVFNSTGFMRGNPLFVIDDEADAASLNTLVNRNRQSSINKYLDIIRSGASSVLYLQVTGTPQAIFLQTKLSGWHPSFTYYFKPGDGYLGGDFFFPNNLAKPQCVTFIDKITNPTHEVVLRHLVVSSQIFLSGGTVCNCLFHPSVRQSVHQDYANQIQSEIQWCCDNLGDAFKEELRQFYSTITPSKSVKHSFEEVYQEAKNILLGNLKILIMNGKNDIDSSEYSKGCNFVVGGNTLGRGVTFPQLQTIYYTRTSKKPQADTMWQHSRMFGYDRDAGLMMVYLDERLYKLFSDINSTNNSIIAQVEHGIENIKVYYPEGLNPTRKNVLDDNYVEAISGGSNYYPNNPKNDTFDSISNILIGFSDEEQYYQVTLKLIKEILSHIVPSDDFNLRAFEGVLDVLLAEKPVVQGILIVRRNRNITQGTGALLSSADWQLGGLFHDKVVLTMYQIIGGKGWANSSIWVPNIKLPDNVTYYDVSE